MTRNKKTSLVVTGAIILVFVVFFMLQITHTTHFLKSSSDKQAQQEAQYNEARKKAAAEQSGGTASDKTSGGSNPATSGNYVPPSNSDGITITPSQTSSTQVVVTTKLVGYSDGTCTLSVTNGSKSVTQNAQVIYQSQFSTCAGFTVPVSSLDTGTWNFSLSILSGGVTTSKSAVYEVK